MIELLDRQQSLTINQWKIFTAVILSIMLDGLVNLNNRSEKPGRD